MKKTFMKKFKMVVKQKKKKQQSCSIKFQFSNYNESKEKCGDSSTLAKIF